MRLLGFDIRRTAMSGGPAQRRSFFDSVSAWRSAFNFTGGASQGYGFTNPWEAMGVPAVYACVSKIAKTVAPCPRQVFDISDPHNARRVTTTPAAILLAGRPNPYQTAYTFWHLATARQPLWGNFYAEIQRDSKTGEAMGLWPLIGGDCTPELKAGKKVFNVGGKLLGDDDILHLMEPGFNGLVGISKIAMHRTTIAGSVAMQSFTEGFYRNGMKSSGAFVLPAGEDELSAEAFERLQESIDTRYSGGTNSGRPMVLEGGLKFDPFSMPMGDAEFVDTQKMQIAQVARIFDMPLHKLQEMDGAKFNNVESQNLSYVIDCIDPINIGHGQELDKLFAPHDRGRLEVRVSTDHLLRGDLPSRFAAMAIARQWSLMTINEIRRTFGLNDIEGGDQLFVPGNANAAAAVTAGASPAAMLNQKTGDE